MEYTDARLNDSAHSNIDQLLVHEVQNSAWNVGGALRKHVGREDAQSKAKEDEVIGRGLVTVMALSSANVDGPRTDGGHVTEGAFAPEVPGVGVLRSNTGAI